MNAKLLITVIAAALLPLAAWAHDCSGGTDGGMDATGNQCNGDTVRGVASTDRAASSSIRKPKAATNERARPAKGRGAAPNASARPPVKRG